MVIDLVKLVSFVVGWSYFDNDVVWELLCYMCEGICQLFNYSICLLLYDGIGNGIYVGVKSWVEDFFMVISLDCVFDGYFVGVIVEFKKDCVVIVDLY